MKAHFWVMSGLLALLACALPGAAEAQTAPTGCSPDYCSAGLQSTYYGGPTYNNTAYYGGRAYNDSDDCTCSSQLAAAGVAIPPQNFIVFFDFDKSTLTPAARSVIQSAVQYAKGNGKAVIDLNGYTDLAGTVAYNLRLSRRRADSVARYMVALGLPRTELVEKGYGKENPRVPTPDGVREAENRRVEIIMP